MASIESMESSSPIVTRAVAAGLGGRYTDNYQFPLWQKALLSILGALPQSVAIFSVSRFQSFSGLSPHVLDNFNIDELIDERLRDYEHSHGPFPAIVLGAALGGATAYLSLALGGPFLPQAYVISLKGGAKNGNVDEYLHRSLNSALRLASNDPRIMTIQHYDPVHDNWLTRFVNHLRFKLLDLPSAYKDFIKSRLQPGGDLVYLDGGAEWLRFRLGPRSVFQVGGWGGISAEEFLQGSQRLQEFSRRSGLKLTDWKLKDFPLERGPESEWGSEPAFGEALKAFCDAEGYRFVPIHLPHPNDFSRLAYHAAQKLIEKEGRTPAGVLVEMFSQYDSTAARLGSLLPLWLVFNTDDSRDYLASMASNFPKNKPVFFSPLSTFSITPDLVPFDGWDAALQHPGWINIGASPTRYPADCRALISWSAPLRKWVKENEHPISTFLTSSELLALK